MCFQKNTLANTDVCVKWAQNTLKPIVLEGFVLFLDNLKGQVAINLSMQWKHW